MRRFLLTRTSISEVPHTSFRVAFRLIRSSLWVFDCWCESAFWVLSRFCPRYSLVLCAARHDSCAGGQSHVAEVPFYLSQYYLCRYTHGEDCRTSTIHPEAHEGAEGMM